jgi:predicted ArsR family transcriptional regulator
MSAQEDTASGERNLQTVFQNSDDPVLTAVEVAERLGITQQAAHQKLTKAHERGEVKRKKTGSRAVVWWIPSQTSVSR